MDDLLLPQASRLIHVGPHKTGSTAIQVALHEARDRLAEHGVRYAGSRHRPAAAGWAIGVRGKPAGWETPGMKPWHDLVADIREAGDLRVCVSNEDFGRAEPEQIRRIVDELGGAEPYVVAVARRLDRYLPSQWQERVKAGIPLGFEAWLERVMARPGEEYSWDRSRPGYDWERTNVWYAHDTEALVRRWAEAVGPERVVVVVSDEDDRHLLLRIFERMLGLPDGLLELYPDRSNRSLSWGEVEFVRATNELLLARGVSRRELTRLVSRGLVADLVSRPAGDEARRTPPLPDWAADQIREISASRIDAIRGLGARVVGDPESLWPSEVVTGDPNDPPGIPGVTAARAADWLIAELSPTETTEGSDAPVRDEQRPGVAARLRGLARRFARPSPP